MRRTIYHGSVSVIEKPVFGASNRANDYGLGFYCTENADLAMEWAVRRDHDGWANEYEIDDDGLAVLNLGDPQYCILHWLAVLLENRQFETEYGLPSEAKAYLSEHFAVPYKTADIIVGYRADDSYFTFAQDFISGAISYSQLAKAMRLGRLGNQYVLKSRRAFERLEYRGSRPATRADWLAKKEGRDSAARREYLESLRFGRVPGDLRIDRIIDERIMPGDDRLR